VVAAVRELASGVHAAQPPLGTRLATRQVGVRVVAHGVEHWDRLTRWGSDDRVTLLALHGRPVEAVCPTDTGDGVVDDVVAVGTTRAARIAGRCTRTRRAAQIAVPRMAGVAQVLPRDSEEA
jgi:predicted site-specific integrase-resolvase